jgi:hypothetical protein
MTPRNNLSYDVTLSFNPTRIYRCRHHNRNDVGATSNGETLNQTHNNQNLNPNGVAATDYKGSKDVGRPLDSSLLGSDKIHGPKTKICCRSTVGAHNTSISYSNMSSICIK